VTAIATEAPVARPEPVVAPARTRWWRGDFGAALVIALGWQLALTGFGTILDRAVLLYRGAGTGALPEPTLLSHTLRWDGFWFQAIVEGAYGTNVQAPAFYPLFPLSVAAVQQASFVLLGFLAAGLLVNIVATWLAITALLRIAREFGLARSGQWLTIAAFLTAGTAFYLHSFYSEAVFVALGFCAYRFALGRRWVPMGLCLLPITASRVTAVLFVLLCFLEFWRSKNWKIRGLLSPHLLWFPASLAGFAGFAVYLKIVRGDALAMTHAYKAGPGWDYHVFNANILSTLSRELGICRRALTGQLPLDHWILVNHLLPVIGLAVLVATSAYAIGVMRGPGIPLGLFGIASVVMFTLNSNLVSVHRYLLPCVVIYLAMVHATERFRTARPAVFGYLYLSSLVQAVLMVFFVSGVWAG
jgi:hypothetical protein